MEVDVAPTTNAFHGASVSDFQFRQLYGQCHDSQSETKLPHLDGLVSDSSSSSRRRKTAFALKSILRHSRSDLGSALSNSHKNNPSGCNARRQKKAVKFLIEDKAVEVRRWNGKRLRCLALDLDMWESLPCLTGSRAGNKQKTRQTKRANFAHNSIDDVKSEESVCRLEMDDEVVLKRSSIDDLKVKGHDSEAVERLTPMSIPEVEAMEKSMFVRRWLRQSKAAEYDEAGLPLPPLSSPHCSGSSCELMMAYQRASSPVYSGAFPVSAGSAGSAGSLASLSSVFNSMSISTNGSRQQ